MKVNAQTPQKTPLYATAGIGYIVLPLSDVDRQTYIDNWSAYLYRYYSRRSRPLYIPKCTYRSRGIANGRVPHLILTRSALQ